MEKGQTVYTLYMAHQFDFGSGFFGWIDEYTVLNPDIGEGMMALTGKYGTGVLRKPDEVYFTKQAAQEAMIEAIQKRVDVAVKQIDTIRAEMAKDQALQETVA